MYKTEEERRLFDLTKSLLESDGQKLSEINAVNLVSQLREAIYYHEWKYYVKNEPVISDFEYDLLYKKLESLEAMYPELVIPSSPTQRVSSDLSASFDAVAHLSPMLSLANSYNADDLRDFDVANKKLLELTDPDLEYCVEPKYDGGSIAIIYENDLLVRAATRGNGQQGDEITANIKTLKSIPLSAEFSSYNIRRIELRGEAIIRKDIFDRLNALREKEEQPLFANPRNAATGGLRMKNPLDTAARGIEAFVYQASYVEYGEGGNRTARLTTQWDVMEMLVSLGFKVPGEKQPNDERKLCQNIEDVISFCERWQERRDRYPYEIDGMVVKINQLRQQQITGSTSHHPRWAIAFKFKAKQATSRLLSVEYQVGKVGSITPVAKVAPVQLAGVTVSSVSLHNEDFIRGKDLRIGDHVLIERAGDVIPYIVKALPELRDGSEKEIVFPEYCPVNKVEKVALVKEEHESAWRCPVCSCGSQDLQRIIFHVSKDAMNIDGLGRSMIERFWNRGWIRDISDIYNLDYQKVGNLDGFGARSVENLRTAINTAKKNPIHRVLHSLSIHHLGKKASKILAARIDHIRDLESFTKEDLTDIKDIGPVLADQIIAYFKDARQVALLQRMEDYGVNMSQTDKDRPRELPTDGPLSGKSILFTGTLQQMGRKEAQLIASEMGAKLASGVSKNLDVLVVGDKAGSKLKKAQAIETIQIMTEEEFLQLKA